MPTSPSSFNQLTSSPHSLWNNFFYSGIRDFEDDRFRTQVFFINVFSFLGFLSLATFGVLHIFVESNWLLGFYEILGGLVLLINQIFMRFTQHTEIAKGVLLSTVLIFLWLMLITGGTQGTGVFWYFTYPAAAFFLTGNHRGLFWMSALYLGSLIVTYLNFINLLNIPYTIVDVRQLLVSLFVVSILIYLYERNRQRIENELVYDEQSLQEFLDNMSTFAVKLDTNGNILLANKIAKQSIGLGDQIIGHSFADGPWLTFDPLAHNRFKDALREALTGKNLTYYENLKIVGSSIVTFSFGLAPIFQDHRVKYVVIEGQDVSQLFNAKYAFNEAEKIAQLGSWEWDIPENKLVWSDGLYKIFGVNRSVILSHEKYLEYIHIEDRDLVQSAFDNSFKTLQKFIADYRIIRPDGETKFCHDEGKVILDNTGKPIKMVGVGQDVTELRKLQNQVKSLSH